MCCAVPCSVAALRPAGTRSDLAIACRNNLRDEPVAWLRRVGEAITHEKGTVNEDELERVQKIASAARACPERKEFGRMHCSCVTFGQERDEITDDRGQRFLIARAFRRSRRLHLLSHTRIIACEILDFEAEFVASLASLGYREDDGSSGPRHAVPNVFGVSVTATRRNRRLPGGRQPASLRVAHTTSAASACAGAESRAISPIGRNHATIAGSAWGKRP